MIMIISRFFHERCQRDWHRLCFLCKKKPVAFLSSDDTKHSTTPDDPDHSFNDIIAEDDAKYSTTLDDVVVDHPHSPVNNNKEDVIIAVDSKDSTTSDDPDHSFNDNIADDDSKHCSDDLDHSINNITITEDDSKHCSTTPDAIVDHSINNIIADDSKDSTTPDDPDHSFNDIIADDSKHSETPDDVVDHSINNISVDDSKHSTTPDDPDSTILFDEQQINVELNIGNEVVKDKSSIDAIENSMEDPLSSVDNQCRRFYSVVTDWNTEQIDDIASVGAMLSSFVDVFATYNEIDVEPIVLLEGKSLDVSLLCRYSGQSFFVRDLENGADEKVVILWIVSKSIIHVETMTFETYTKLLDEM